LEKNVGPKIHQIKTTVKLHETDAAGILFFGNYFKIAHDAYESFMTSIGFPFSWILDKADFLVLIAHAESEYRQSLFLGEKVTVELTVESLGQTSFVLHYIIANEANDPVAIVKTVHVAVAKDTNTKMHLPDELREKLSGE
jgi:1,4-dihydroxy-2-naphthoyl-CoA hydrolase